MSVTWGILLIRASVWLTWASTPTSVTSPSLRGLKHHLHVTQPGTCGEQQAAAEPQVGQVECRSVERDVEPVHDPSVQRCGRAGQAVQEIAGRAPGGESGAESLCPAGRSDGADPEQDDARHARDCEKRLVSCGDAERGTVIDDELKAQQAADDGDPVPAAESR